MTRHLALALLIGSLAACASAPTPEDSTSALLHDIVRDRSAPLRCAAEMYCITPGSRIAGDRNKTCSCDPPGALSGLPIAR
jgi:hypothetical protein